MAHHQLVVDLYSTYSSTE